MVKRYKRNTKRKYQKKKQYFRKKGLSISRGPVPRTSLVKLRYCQNIALDGSASTTSRNFRANSMYDPDNSITSSSQHQPLAFDQYMLLYKNFVVLGAKITVTPINTADIPIIFGVTLRQAEASNASVNPTALQEQGDTGWAYVGNLSTSGVARSVTKKMSTKKYMGYKNPTNEAELRGTAASNPEKMCYFQVWTASADGITNPGSLSFQIMIEYVALLSNPIVLAQS